MAITLVGTRPVLGKTNRTATMHRASAGRRTEEDARSCPRDAKRRDASDYLSTGRPGRN